MILVAANSACYGPGPETSAAKPELSITFPSRVDAGSTHTALLEVSNPGPEDIGALFVSFSRVGVASGVELPAPIVDVVPKNGSSAVVDVDPRPVAVGNGIRYRFRPLQAGSSASLEFELRVPEQPGVAANAVLVYDGEDPARAKGVLLETNVTS